MKYKQTKDRISTKWNVQWVKDLICLENEHILQ